VPAPVEHRPVAPAPEPVPTPPAQPEKFVLPEPLPPIHAAEPFIPAPHEPVHAPVPPLLFECAWEVCWQLGGIYTVLRSKAAAMTARWGDRYCLIGPYNPATAALEFEERPSEGLVREVLDRLRHQGVACHYGRWLIAGRPRVILLDHRSRYPRLGEDKYLFWKDHGITTPDGDGEVNDVLAFGFTVAEFFRQLCEVKGEQPVLAHFHEWMGGAAVPRIAHTRLPVTTVFTTHATLLGRYLASDNPLFYDHLPFLNGDELADKYRILPRHQIEKAAAHAAVVFTTVSEVTDAEATQLLGRKADVITPNGLNLTRFHALHEFQNLHAQFKQRIHQFVMGHFFPSYTFDLDRTLYVFTSGRYEYKNKGMDLFLEVLNRLNQRLRQIPDPPTVIAFIVTRAASRHFNVEALRSQAQFRELQNTCAELERAMGQRLLTSTLTGRLPSLSELITPDASVRLKRAMHAWRSTRQPLVVTHDLADDAGDPILKHIRHRGMFNAADDPVKVVFHPEFLSATSPLINLDYDSFVRGCHLGIFPSYYEPWGYTPLEAIALGVPAVTTDLSGFGAYVQRHIDRHDDNGIFVLKRRQRSFDDSAEDLVQYLLQFCGLNRRQRIELRNRVERLSDLFDWARLASHYHEAHDMALERTLGRRPGKFEIKMV
jgi:glycogen(starch) synthase